MGDPEYRLEGLRNKENSDWVSDINNDWLLELDTSWISEINNDWVLGL